MENKKLIKESFDWRYFRTQIIVSVSLVLGMLLLLYVLAQRDQKKFMQSHNQTSCLDEMKI